MDEDKNRKRMRKAQKYRVEYTKEWSCFVRSKLSENHVLCTVCGHDFSVASGGRDDCRRHYETKKHKEYEKLKAGNKTLENLFKSSTQDDVTRAEMLFASFIIEHNLPIAITEHAGPLFRAMFPDSEIAKKYASSRTKTSAIIKSMASFTQNCIVDTLKNNPFALATDGSNDLNDVKLYPIVVSYFNESLGKIETNLLSIVECSENTGEGIFKSIDNEFRKRGIPWSNCVSFSCDNANTMIGHIKGVAAFIEKVQPSIIIQGCSCHIIHLAAKKASAGLKQINVEQFLVQLYYYLEKSSKRKYSFKLCQEVCGDTPPHKILKYVSTRWLSLLEAVNRVLEQWEAIVQFVSSVNEDCEDLKTQLQNPLLKLYCLFLSNTLPLFVNINVCFQEEAPSIHLLKRKMECLLMDLLARFVKPSAFPANSISIMDVEFKSKKNQKEDADLVIGAKAKSYIKENFCQQDKGLINFYTDVRNFYKLACDYILKKFPFQNEVIKHAEVVDISLQKNVSYSSIEYFVQRFKNIFPNVEEDKFEEQFVRYQFEDLTSLNFPRMDKAWNHLSNIVDASGIRKYDSLGRIMSLILLIPHSNAYTERVFSIVRKNKNEFRPNLSTDTLSALLVEKTKCLSIGDACYMKKFSKDQLKAAKQATG